MRKSFLLFILRFEYSEYKKIAALVCFDATKTYSPKAIQQYNTTSVPLNSMFCQYSLFSLHWHLCNFECPLSLLSSVPSHILCVFIFCFVCCFYIHIENFHELSPVCSINLFFSIFFVFLFILRLYFSRIHIFAQFETRKQYVAMVFAFGRRVFQFSWVRLYQPKKKKKQFNGSVSSSYNLHSFKICSNFVQEISAHTYHTYTVLIIKF